MSPVLPCPECKKPYAFHEDEVEMVQMGATLCLDCGIEVQRNALIIDMFLGVEPLPEDEGGDEE